MRKEEMLLEAEKHFNDCIINTTEMNYDYQLTKRQLSEIKINNQVIENYLNLSDSQRQEKKRPKRICKSHSQTLSPVWIETSAKSLKDVVERNSRILCEDKTRHLYTFDIVSTNLTADNLSKLSKPTDQNITKLFNKLGTNHILKSVKFGGISIRYFEWDKTLPLSSRSECFTFVIRNVLTTDRKLSVMDMQNVQTLIENNLEHGLKLESFQPLENHHKKGSTIRSISQTLTTESETQTLINKLKYNDYYLLDFRNYLRLKSTNHAHLILLSQLLRNMTSRLNMRKFGNVQEAVLAMS